MVVLIMKKRRLGNLCIANSEGKNPRRKSGSRPTVSSVKDAILILDRQRGPPPAVSQSA